MARVEDLYARDAEMHRRPGPKVPMYGIIPRAAIAELQAEVEAAAVVDFRKLSSLQAAGSTDVELEERVRLRMDVPADGSDGPISVEGARHTHQAPNSS